MVRELPPTSTTWEAALAACHSSGRAQGSASSKRRRLDIDCRETKEAFVAFRLHDARSMLLSLPKRQQQPWYLREHRPFRYPVQSKQACALGHLPRYDYENGSSAAAVA
jgi:hypothetical protein